MRTPGAVPNLCKADSGLSAMTGIFKLVAIVTPSGSLQDSDTSLYLLVSNSVPIVRAQDKGARIFGPPTLPVKGPPTQESPPITALHTFRFIRLKGQAVA